MLVQKIRELVGRLVPAAREIKPTDRIPNRALVFSTTVKLQFVVEPGVMTEEELKAKVEQVKRQFQADCDHFVKTNVLAT